MSYYASYSGVLHLKQLTRDELIAFFQATTDVWDLSLDPEKIVATSGKNSGGMYALCDSINLTMDKSKDNVIFVDGYNKYREEYFSEWFAAISKFIDYGSLSQIEFIGEDNSLWRLRLIEGGYEEDIGRVVYD